MSHFPERCRQCGADFTAGSRFVRYVPDASDIQRETDWGSDLPDLTVAVCGECGTFNGVVVPDDRHANPGGSVDESRFRVDDDLR